MSLAVAVQNQLSQPVAGVLATSQAGALSEMRSYLAGVKPQSAADALRLLRNAYPQTPLSLRVAACGL